MEQMDADDERKPHVSACICSIRVHLRFVPHQLPAAFVRHWWSETIPPTGNEPQVSHREPRDPAPASTPRTSVRLRQLRVIWLPLLLIFLDGLLLVVCVVVALLLAPVALVTLLLVALLRILISTLTGGRLFGERRMKDAGEPSSAAGGAGRTTLSAAARRNLAMRYRPCIVAFPETAELGPPYRTGEVAHLAGADYHPRAVELFLNHVRLRQGRTQWLPDLPETTPIADIRASLGRPGEHESSLEIPWLHGGNPIRIVRHLFPFGRQLRAHWAMPVPKADCGCSLAALERYLRIVQHDDQRPAAERRYPHTLYTRVLEVREMPELGDHHPLADAVALQYWWFLLYNDAWNRHHGDWEGITLFLRPGPDGYSPLGAAYAAHDIGRWRRWQDVQRVGADGMPDDAGTHPLVYMARGSHASYFDYSETGYHPQMSRKLRVPFVGDYAIPSQFVLEGRTATDWVARVGSGVGNGVKILTDNVKVMPPEAVLSDLRALRADDDWWWLAYRGLWGAPEFLPFFGGSGPRGLKWQGAKWSNPFRWVMRDCIADDLPYWMEMFASWQPPDDALPGLDDLDEDHDGVPDRLGAGSGEPAARGIAPQRTG